MREALKALGAAAAGVAVTAGAFLGFDQKAAEIDPLAICQIAAAIELAPDAEPLFYRTASLEAEDADLITVQLPQENDEGERRTVFLTWAEGGDFVVVEVVQAGRDPDADPDPITPELADCLTSNAPEEARVPIR